MRNHLFHNQDKRAQAYEILILQEGTVDRLRGPVGQGSVKVLSNASNEGTIYAKNNRTQETFYSAFIKKWVQKIEILNISIFSPNMTKFRSRIQIFERTVLPVQL